jgi:hypothetical protein
MMWLSRVHPALEPAVHELAEPEDLVRADLAGGPIPLLVFRAVEDNVEFDEGVTNPLRAEGLKVRVELGDHCLENHDAIGSYALVVPSNTTMAGRLSIVDLGPASFSAFLV